MNRRSLGYSAAFHLIILLLVIFGLPYFAPTIEEQPQIVTVELLPLSNKSNAPNMIKAKKPEKIVPKKEQPKPKQEKPEPDPVKPEPIKKEEPKKEEPKPEPKKEEKKPKLKKEEPTLDEILKNLAKESPKKNETKVNSKEVTPAEPDNTGDKDIKSNQFDPTAQISMSEKDAIRSQILKCWNPPIGSKDAENLVVVVRVSYQPDGTVANVYLSTTQVGRYNSEPTFRAAAESAMRAVRACQPITGLPAEKYQGWKDVELAFDPRDML